MNHRILKNCQPVFCAGRLAALLVATCFVCLVSTTGLANSFLGKAALPAPTANWIQEEFDEDEEEPDEKSLEEIIQYARKQLPEFADYIREIQEDLEEEEANEIIVDLGRELITRFEEARENFGRRTANKVVELFMVEIRIDRLLEDADPDEEEIPTLKKRIKELITRRFALHLAIDKAELHQLKSEADDLEEELRRRTENRNEIIEGEIGETLREYDLDFEEESEKDRDPSVESNGQTAAINLSIAVTKPEAEAAGKLDFEKEILPLFTSSCFDCHSNENNEGELNLQSLLTDLPLVKNRRRWINVYEQTRNHVMPPADADGPNDSDRRKMVAWIHHQIFHFDYSKVDNPGFEPVRRLTHREYANAIRDLLKTDLDVLSRFPSDLSATSGFDNSGNSLFIQPLLMGKYIQIAEAIAKEVVGQELSGEKDPAFIRTRISDNVTPAMAIKQNLKQFLTLAFRRPVDSEELSKYEGIFLRSYAQHQDFAQANQKVLQAILISPNFLFRLESSPQNSRSHRIPDIELANRLSFFLWSSIPDNELLSLASQSKLIDDKILEQQVLRMLSDPRSSALGDGFGSQWLGFQHLGTRIRADPIDNPWCTDSLMDAMKKETSLLVQSLIRDNRPIRELLTTKHTYVNEELAKFYRIEGIKGPKMQRTPSPPRRGGLLGHASILAVTSYPYQTSPVKRGTWILTDILGTPPPPPPPGASEIEESIEENDRLSFRQKLARHSRDSRCASCHRQIDPLGFGLEGFDWFGRLRSRRVNASGQLPDGTRFRGLDELNQVLVKNKLDEIASNFIRRLLSFSLGRQLEYYDEKTVQAIVAATRANDYPMRDIVLEVVKSYPFQYKRVKQIDNQSPDSQSN